MKFGVREICDVVLRAKAAMKVGEKVFYKNEPVLYFDSLKTSTLEGAATTVYAQGGRGNARLIAWEGERTVTFTMEDALISPAGFSILTGAGLTKADNDKNKIIIHKTEITTIKEKSETDFTVELSETPYFGETATADSADDNADYVYVMLLDENGEVDSEPYIASELTGDRDGKTIKVYAADSKKSDTKTYSLSTTADTNHQIDNNRVNDFANIAKGKTVLVDYYVAKTSGAFQIDITPDKFGGNFYLEASTLFRATNGVDMPAEFIIPNCKIQSNFTFTMASSGDPSTFTFTMDAFPDYTRWNPTKKVFAAIQVIEDSDTLTDFERLGTPHNHGSAAGEYNTTQKDHIEKD